MFVRQNCNRQNTDHLCGCGSKIFNNCSTFETFYNTYRTSSGPKYISHVAVFSRDVVQPSLLLHAGRFFQPSCHCSSSFITVIGNLEACSMCVCVAFSANPESSENMEELDEDIAVSQSKVNFTCPLTQVGALLLAHEFASFRLALHSFFFWWFGHNHIVVITHWSQYQENTPR